MPRTLTKTRFATLVGISKQLLGHHAKGALREAINAAGVDIDHPATARFLERRGVTPDQLVERDAGARSAGADRAPTKTAKGRPARSAAPMDARRFDDPPDASALYSLTFREIADRFGSAEGFETWVELRKKTAETKRVELQNEVTQGNLIEREFVRTHLVGLIDGAWRRLLHDMPKNLAHRVRALINTGATNEDIEALIRSTLSDNLNHVKSSAIGRLKSARKQETP